MFYSGMTVFIECLKNLSLKNSNCVSFRKNIFLIILNCTENGPGG